MIEQCCQNCEYFRNLHMFPRETQIIQTESGNTLRTNKNIQQIEMSSCCIFFINNPEESFIHETEPELICEDYKSNTAHPSQIASYANQIQTNNISGINISEFLKI